MMSNKTFDILSVSSKFAICGLPLRADTYKTCSFNCRYCFANNRKIMEFEKTLQIGNIPKLKRKLDKIFIEKKYDTTNFLDVLIANNYTWHCGGMSDPFQPIEKKLGITKQLIEITKPYGINILFSTKSDNLYGADSIIDNQLHAFQMSITNIMDRKDIEPSVSSIQNRMKLYRSLKDRGFKVGIRIQPFIPNVSTLDIVKMFNDADMFVIEGIKIVPQNKECKEYILDKLGLDINDFTQMGLLNLKPEIRLKLYEPFIEYFEKNKMSYSIADNDLRYIGNNKCCCGDKLIKKSTTFNTTYLLWKNKGDDWTKQEVDKAINESEAANCRCNNLFTSNRQQGARTVQEYYDLRFYRDSSPFSPSFQYRKRYEQLNLFDFDCSGQ